jgi:hypothetical protein
VHILSVQRGIALWKRQFFVIMNMDHEYRSLMTFKARDTFRLSINAICSDYEVNKVKGLVVHFTMKGVLLRGMSVTDVIIRATISVQ